MAHEEKKDFDLELVLQAFKRSQKDDGNLSLGEYLNAYVELCRFFKLMGPIFSFVAHDVGDKIHILEGHLKGKPEEYDTIQSMIDYEVSNNITRVGGRPPSGARTLLRLHRALEFIIAFIRRISHSSDTDRTSHLAAEVYKETLAKHHLWIVQKMAALAMYTLPSRKDLIEMMCKHEYEMVLELCEDFATVAQPIYDITQKIYEDNELLALP